MKDFNAWLLKNEFKISWISQAILKYWDNLVIKIGYKYFTNKKVYRIFYHLMSRLAVTKFVIILRHCKCDEKCFSNRELKAYLASIYVISSLYANFVCQNLIMERTFLFPCQMLNTIHHYIHHHIVISMDWINILVLKNRFINLQLKYYRKRTVIWLICTTL